MLTAEARVATDRASWYLAKLCWHANRMGHTVPRQSPPHGGGGAPPEIRRAEWSDSHGIIDFGWGQCTLEATGGLLLLRTEAADDGSLGRLQDGIGRRLETMGRRDHLTVNWHRVEPAQGSTPLRRRVRRRCIYSGGRWTPRARLDARPCGSSCSCRRCAPRAPGRRAGGVAMDEVGCRCGFGIGPSGGRFRGRSPSGPWSPGPTSRLAEPGRPPKQSPRGSLSLARVACHDRAG
jgi:hypothetical protein